MVFKTKSKTEFFARQEILNLLLKRVEASKCRYRQNIALLGNQSLGKTSLIFELLRISKNPDIIPIYLDVKPKSIEALAQNFIGVLLYQYLSLEEDILEDNLDFLIKNSRTKIPKTIQQINQIRKLLKEKKHADEIYSLLLDLPQTIHEETQKTILLIFDEFHNIDSLGLRNPFLELSNKIMVQKHTMYIVVSSAVHSAQLILSEKLSLLFGNFEIVNLEPFNETIAKTFIDNKLQNIQIRSAFKNFIIQFTGGYPFYLDAITEQLKTVCLDNDCKNISEKILLSSLFETMYKDHGILNQFFNNKYYRLLNNGHMNIFPEILLAIATGCRKPSQITTRLNRKTRDINKYLNKLMQMDIISKKGVFNYINDPLFENWLKHVLQKKQHSFNINVHLAAQKFEEDILQSLTTFIDESKKDVPQRLKEIFTMFENDIIELDKKRFMLTRFDEIDIKDNNTISMVRARRANKHWRCYIEKDFIDELKINEVLSDTKRKDCIKKILIALKGIDVNARLKALEARMWIWDQNILNQLLTLFEKPRFMK
ncbi:MAG: ATP-binding protein [PVC group bacterium]|nr:ATP-binding protein [PVC group bacterium]